MHVSTPHIALIVAGGIGTRMQTDIPKQFLLLNNLPVLMHTIKAFSHCQHIVLVLPDSQIPMWHKLCLEYNFDTSHLTIVSGGENRYQSVKNGLLPFSHLQQAIVSIHDGVRPLVSLNLINACFSTALQKGNAIAAVPSKDSVRMVRPNGISQHLDRSGIYQVQTPQTFKNADIINYYNQVPYNDTLTDDASVAEAAGQKIHLCKGEYSNIKITTPEDLAIAHALM
jgi:2-C-methyl-D-erythritol 4-phosphate cytidylyltransferase